MKITRLLCLLSAITSLPTHAAGEADLQKLQGRWETSPEVREVVAANCGSLSYEIAANTITLRSGDLVLVTRYEVETPGPEYSLKRTVVSNNGRKNCYGAVVPEAAGQRLENMRVDLLGDRIRIHLPGSRGGERSFEMVRSAR